ncbi:MAG: phosphatase PAP2 family protein [Flavisolibacter sp.]
MKRICFVLFVITNTAFAQKQTPDVQQQVWSITEVMFHDVINPPAAARFYSYAVLTGYEIISELDTTLPAFQKKLKTYPVFVPPSNQNKINKELAALYGILETGKNTIPSGYLLEEKQQELLKSFSQLTKEEVEASVAFAKSVSQKIVQYSKMDGYFKLSTLSRYRPLEGEGYWQPTPPEYMAAVEPNWKTIRTFFLDSPQQCALKTMLPFDKNIASSFYQLANEVYTTSRALTKEQKLVANFWDCNPFAVQFQGHMSVGLKKISPGGHWMGITGIACQKAGLSLSSTLLLHTVVALSLHDAFVCCWNEKFRTNRIRPETVINRYIDEKWQPLLQTPPFPEYPSGHSVVSTAAAEVLTHLLGDHFAFTDTVETYIGLPPRKFNSFYEAAAEARISRLYGGIHFRDAIENGATQGGELAKLAIRILETEPLLRNKLSIRSTSK